MKILISIIVYFALSNVTGVAMATAEKKSTPAKKTNAIQELDLDVLGELEAWRDRAGQSLKRDNGWLTLAGRFVMKPGANTFGTGADNDIVFPAALNGVGPERLGVINVDEAAKSVTLTMADGAVWTADGKPIASPRLLDTSTDKRDWVALDNIAMHVIARDGKYILRLADNKSAVRANFNGRKWYPPAAKFRVVAKYMPYPPGKTIAIVNVLDEVSDEPSPGYVEFKLNGVKYKLDAVGDGEGLFFVMRDKTSGDTTYRPSRFLAVEKKPELNKPFWLDFNRAYNPPCAFSEFTTCPLPPKQNILRVRIDAGEKYPKM